MLQSNAGHTWCTEILHAEARNKMIIYWGCLFQFRRTEELSQIRHTHTHTKPRNPDSYSGLFLNHRSPFVLYSLLSMINWIQFDSNWSHVAFVLQILSIVSNLLSILHFPANLHLHHVQYICQTPLQYKLLKDRHFQTS